MLELCAGRVTRRVGLCKNDEVEEQKKKNLLPTKLRISTEGLPISWKRHQNFISSSPPSCVKAQIKEGRGGIKKIKHPT